MTPIAQGLMISIIGLLLAFTFMAIFIGVIVLLQKIFPYKDDSEEEAGNNQETPVMVAAETGSEDEVVAAIAVALSLTRSSGESQIGSDLLAGRGTWWVSRRIAASQDAGLSKK